MSCYGEADIASGEVSDSGSSRSVSSGNDGSGGCTLRNASGDVVSVGGASPALATTDSNINNSLVLNLPPPNSLTSDTCVEQWNLDNLACCD
jgi:hypothetical protein